MVTGYLIQKVPLEREWKATLHKKPCSVTYKLGNWFNLSVLKIPHL